MAQPARARGLGVACISLSVTKECEVSRPHQGTFVSLVRCVSTSFAKVREENIKDSLLDLEKLRPACIPGDKRDDWVSANCVRDCDIHGT